MGGILVPALNIIFGNVHMFIRIECSKIHIRCLPQDSYSQGGLKKKMNYMFHKRQRIVYGLLLIVIAVGVSGCVQSVKRIPSITYESNFFGHDVAVSRSFTNYGWDFRSTGTKHLDLHVTHLLLADCNGDGLDDIVGYDSNTGVVVWIEQTGTFQEIPDFVVLPAEHREEALFEPEALHEYNWRPGGGTFVAGDFNGDGYADIGLVNPDGKGNVVIRYNDKNGSFSSETSYFIGVYDEQVVAGDFNGDGFFDLCVYDPVEGNVSVLFGSGDGTFPTRVDSVLTETVTGGQILAADFNQSRWWDIAFFRSDVFPDGFYFLFGRGDGNFGPRSDEMGTRAEMNLKAWFSLPILYDSYTMPVAGILEHGLPAGIGVYDPELKQIHFRLHRGPAAYNYSSHLIFDSEEQIYKLWYGARWRSLDENGQQLPLADGDHIAYAYSKDGKTWFRELAEPLWYKGEEEGINDWWGLNYLEPELVKVNGTYYMFFQVMIRPGDKVDTGEVATVPADRILIATSKDGVNWERKTDRGIVINLTDPEKTKLTHEEVLYVADDKDGKPWWLYVFAVVDGKGTTHYRIRSADPTTFDWRNRETVSGLSQLGNQLAYADEAPGGRVFFRITFTQWRDRTVPTLQVSRDGLKWEWSKVYLAGSEHDGDYKNIYFLGISTIDGTGKLQYIGNGQYYALYAGTTSKSPIAPEIFKSHIGLGEVIITFDDLKK